MVTVMKVVVDGEEKDYRAVWMDENYEVKLIDQRKLPWKFEIYTAKSYRDTINAIKEMVVRGAPSIGVTGAYALVQAIKESLDEKNVVESVNRKKEEILLSRPTAVNLRNSLEEIWNYFLKISKEGLSREDLLTKLRDKADELADREVEANSKIGEYGSKLIPSEARIITHCNTGALAAVDIGTALAPIRYAHREGKDIFVYVRETRPWLQGARLTAWELKNEKIPHVIITDSAAGFFMWKGEVDLVIVGADRITRRGDVANKIGTYPLAVLARENGIPFYVAAPLSTFDKNTTRGDLIPIEMRNESEVLYVKGISDKGEIERVRIAPEGSRALNPVFDITPARYISGIITEKGVFRGKKEIKEVFEKYLDK